MKTRAAILRERHQPWSVEEIELDPPKAGEVLVKLVASGICHSDEHLVTGHFDYAGPTPPVIGGHEGSGIVQEVGEGVATVAPGDHVVFSFVPACGRCPSCVRGRSNICDEGIAIGHGLQVSDGTSRHHTLDGLDLALMCCLGTFAEYTVVNEVSCVKIQPEWPLDKAALLGCGVATGWGSAVNVADVRPGDFVCVVGVGGIGAAAIQGARAAGARVIAAVDPVEFKREEAKRFGATYSYASISEATEQLGESTWGRGFDKIIMCAGEGDGAMLGEAFWLGGKGSILVVTNIHPIAEQSVSIPMGLLSLFDRQIRGSMFGSGNARSDIPELMELYTQGQLMLDEMITRTYSLDEINEGFEALRKAENVRGVILFD
jgi:NDMA-dependent alcohol dehydrogenase